MSAALADSGVQQQLEHALSTGHVPDEERRRATQLLKRLKSSVRVVMIGKSGSGKSRLINMLAGQTVIPDTPGLPPLEVRYGACARTVYLMADGSEQACDGVRFDQPWPPETAIIRAEMPLEVLRRISLTEVSLEGSPADRQAIAGWAMDRADIVLWCSQSFDAAEQALWAPAKEALKDHSFLVLTKADQLQMKGVLSDRIAGLEDIVAEEFFRMYPLATIQAISAGCDGKGRDEALWASSGGKALVDAINRLVNTGRSADADNALMFLRRNAPDLPDHHPPGADGAEGAATPAPARANPLAATPDPDIQPGPQPGPKLGPKLGLQPDPAPRNIDTKVFREALEFLQHRANQMLRTIREDGSDKQAVVLDHCLETANKLTEIIMEVEATDPALSEIQDDVMECGDMMVLFHLEKTEDAAEDAVTLLLQLKKEMAIAVAS